MSVHALSNLISVDMVDTGSSGILGRFNPVPAERRGQDWTSPGYRSMMYMKLLVCPRRMHGFDTDLHA